MHLHWRIVNKKINTFNTFESLQDQYNVPTKVFFFFFLYKYLHTCIQENE